MKPKRPLTECMALTIGLNFVIEFIANGIDYKYDNPVLNLFILIIVLLCIRYFVNCLILTFEYIVDYINWRKNDER